MLEALSIPSLTGVSCALDKGDSFYSACFMICMTDSSFFSRINFMRLRKKYAWRNCHAESKKGPVTDSCIPLFPSDTTSSTPFSPFSFISSGNDFTFASSYDASVDTYDANMFSTPSDSTTFLTFPVEASCIYDSSIA